MSQSATPGFTHFWCADKYLIVLTPSHWATPAMWIGSERTALR
jgi:hypothetical protein